MDPDHDLIPPLPPRPQPRPAPGSTLLLERPSLPVAPSEPAPLGWPATTSESPFTFDAEWQERARLVRSVRTGSTAPAAGPARARRAGRALAYLLIGLLMLLMAAQVALAAFHVRPLVVRSGSMTPTIVVGDVVISQRVPATSIAVGQIVTFHDPTRGNALVTHRVRAVRAQAGTVSVETRGDANTASEKWSVPASGTVGRERAVLPKIGWVIGGMQSGWVRIAAILLASLWAGAVLLRKIWES